jgi:ABC-type transport system involved in multi-copper enzyme maturation permease subunit
MNAQIGAQMNAVRVLYVFPRSIVTMLHQGTWVFMAAAFVTASWIGSEFDWGTIRNVFLIRPERGRFLATRLASVILIMTIALALTGLLGAILPALTGIGSGMAAPEVPPRTIPLAAFGAWVWALAFIAVAALAAVLTRSPIFALILTAGYFLLDGLIANLPVWGSSIEGVRSVLLGVRLNGLTADVQRASGLVDPSGVSSVADDFDPLLGLLVVAFWIGLAFGLAYLVLRRADIRE